MFITAYVGKFGYLGNGSYIYHVEQLSISSKIKVMTQATMFSHKELEFYIYKLQAEGKITDPCVVDDLITCIKTHAKFEFK
jgi:hypothetical protein